MLFLQYRYIKQHKKFFFYEIVILLVSSKTKPILASQIKPFALPASCVRRDYFIEFIHSRCTYIQTVFRIAACSQQHVCIEASMTSQLHSYIILLRITYP